MSRGYTGDDVTVVMAVRDGERYLAAAIDSILEQSQTPREVVVVDDGSGDRTPEILAGYGDPLRVVRQPPSGQFAAMNRGIAAASTPLLAFLDADDLFTPRSLELRLARLGGPDEPDAVFGRLLQFVSPELPAAEAARLRYEPGPQRVQMFSAMAVHRHAFDRVGPLDDGLRTSSNLDWMSRARVAGLRTVEIDAVVTRRRLHTTNIGRTAPLARNRDLLHVVRAHRRRMADVDTGDGR